MSVAEVMEPTAGAEEATTPAEVPATPDAPESPAPVAETAPADPTGESSRPRDPKTGRFIKADGTLASDAEQATMEAESPASPQPPTPAPPAPTGDPFVFRASGEKITLPDATLNPDGDLVVKAGQVPFLRQLLAEGVEHRRTFRTREQEWNQKVEQAKATETARADKYNRAAVMLFEAVSSQDWLTAAAADPREVQYLIRELGLELQKADLTIPKTEVPKDAGPTEPDPVAIEHDARATLKGYIEELLERPQAKAVYDTPKKRQALERRLQRRLAAYFTQLEDGSIALHENRVDEDFDDELNERLAIKQEADRRAEEARKAAEFNARRAAPPAPVPPVVSTKAPPAPPPQPTKYESREEWRRKNGLS